MNARIIRNATLLAIGAILLTFVALVAWLAIYAAAIDPGHPLAFYEAYAADNGGGMRLIISVPIFFGAGWLIGRGAIARIEGAKLGFLVAVIYILIDFALDFLLRTAEQTDAQQLISGYAVALAASIAGGWLAAGRVAGQDADPAA